MTIDLEAIRWRCRAATQAELGIRHIGNGVIVEEFGGMHQSVATFHYRPGEFGAPRYDAEANALLFIRARQDVTDLLAEVERLRAQLQDLWICNHAATCDVKPTEFDGGPCPHKVPHRRGREFTATDCYCMWYVDAECVLVEDGGSDD